MAQLTALDAGFLKSRDPERHPGLAIGAVAVVNGAAPSYDQLKTVLTERIKSIPRCTQVLATEWIDYPGFDLTQHVRRVALPRPGDEAELFRAIALALERPLDPDRPLWECWIIEGLNGNRWAILIKIHHCMAGAMSAAHLLARLCDDADGSAFANNVDIKQIPPYGDARSWAETLWRMSVSIAGAVCTAAARAVSWPAVTSPAGPVTTRRRYQAVRVPRDAVDAVCHKFGVTANDVALAAITEGFRTVLLHRGQQPRADSLRTLEKTDGSSAMLPYLPVEYDDPVRRLRTVHNPVTAERPSSTRQSVGLYASHVVRQDDSRASSVTATRHRHPGDQCTQATPPVTADGPEDGPGAAHPAHRTAAEHRDRGPQLRR